MKPLAILSLFVPVVCAAQLFSNNTTAVVRFSDVNDPMRWDIATHTQISGGTLGWNSTLSGSDLSAGFSQTRVTILSTPFPLPPVRATNVFSVTYTAIVDGSNIASQTVPQGVPTFDVGANGYTVNRTPAPVSFTVSVSYVLTENGSTVSSGTETYQVSGFFDPVVAINTDEYPTSVRPVYQMNTFSPDSGVLVSLTAPSGQVFNVSAQAVVVPEPWQYSVGFAGALAGFAIWRRRRSN